MHMGTGHFSLAFGFCIIKYQLQQTEIKTGTWEGSSFGGKMVEGWYQMTL